MSEHKEDPGQGMRAPVAQGTWVGPWYKATVKATVGVAAPLTLLLSPAGQLSLERGYISKKSFDQRTSRSHKPPDSKEETSQSRPSGRAIEEHAEKLVRDGVLGGQPEQSRARAVEMLEQATADQSDYTALWVHTCGRLKATGAAHLIEEVLAQDGPESVLFAAIDAARMTIEPATQPERAKRVADRLERLAEQLLPRAPFVAARALMGTVLLEGPGCWPRLAIRFAHWPPKHLQPTLRVLRRQLGAMRPEERGTHRGAEELRREAVALEKRMRESNSMDDHFTRADLLELIGRLEPLAPLQETVDILHSAYAQNEPVVCAGAVAAARALCLERREAFPLFAVAAQGPRLLQAAMALRPPPERKS
jgi:hypothetical protein